MPLNGTNQLRVIEPLKPFLMPLETFFSKKVYMESDTRAKCSISDSHLANSRVEVTAQMT